MGSVFKKSATKPLPPGADIFIRKEKRFARWKDAKNRTRTAPITTGRDGQVRIVITSRTYTAKYRDGSGFVQEVPTGCRDETAARSILANLERRAEMVKGKVLTAGEDAIIDHQAMPLPEHFDAYVCRLQAKEASPVRIANMKSQFGRVATECGFRKLADLNGDKLARWLVERQADGMSAATRNGYRETMVMFANWCASGASPRLMANPFLEVPKANTKSDPRRKRRSLTEAELVKLLDVARCRPLLDAMTVRRGKRKGEVVAKLKPEGVERLEWIGRERALIYKTLVLTGLRKGELASVTVGQLHLDGPHPYAELFAADEKNREGSSIALRPDLADDLRQWLAEKATALRKALNDAPSVPFELQNGRTRGCATDASGESDGRVCLPITGEPALPLGTRLFIVPTGLVRILNRDLRRAGIPKQR